MIQLSVLQTFADLFSNFKNIEIGQIAMLAIGAVLIYLAIKKEMEPSLLLPLGFGTILVNLPMSGAIGEDGPITVLFSAGISTGELFPLLLFIGIGAMIDFGPLLKNPWLMLSALRPNSAFSSHSSLHHSSLILRMPLRLRL